MKNVTINAPVTPFSVTFERSETSLKLASLDGRTLEAHEGFNRGNDGGWVMPIKDSSGEVVGRAEIFFRGKAKRNQEYSAPDADGQAIASAFAAQVNKATANPSAR